MSEQNSGSKNPNYVCGSPTKRNFVVEMRTWPTVTINEILDFDF